jgi:formylglycine-generating enzyme required for sulfatase activity
MRRQSQLAEALADARRRTDELFTLLVPDAFYDRPIPERHRNIFYLGHLEAFDWNLICRKTLDLPSFHPEFDKLFEFGIDPPAGRLPEDQPKDWPSVDEVKRYNTHVRQAVIRALTSGDVPEQLWRVAIEHRLMHAETFAYMLHNLPADRKIEPPGVAARILGPPVSRAMIEVPAGGATLGRRRGNGFGWDNEFDEHTVDVPAFAIDNYKVTNGDYLEFVKAGADPPHFWVRRGDEWLQRTMFGHAPLPLTWPVYVTQQQASSYAAWIGKALPTEPQFHRAAYLPALTPAFTPTRTPARTPDPTSRDCKERFPDAGNYNFDHWNPVPVNAHAPGQMLGNGWEWTSTVFQPFPGFEPFPFYPGYSANFFDGDHYVLKGASARTAACFLRPSFRNWFRPDYPYVYAGFRCVEN